MTIYDPSVPPLSTKADGPDNPKTEVKQHDPQARVMSPTPVGIIKVDPM